MTEPAPAPALPTREEALALAEQISTLSAERATHDAHYKGETGKLQAAADAVLGPIDAELTRLRAQLEPWYAANEAELCGKKKSAEFGGCVLKYRIGNPTVRHGEPDDEGAVFMLRAADLDSYIRLTPSLDRPALTKAIAAEVDALALAKAAKTLKKDLPKTPLLKLGFSLRRARTFVAEAAAGSRQPTEVAA